MEGEKGSAARRQGVTDTDTLWWDNWLFAEYSSLKGKGIARWMLRLGFVCVSVCALSNPKPPKNQARPGELRNTALPGAQPC